MMGLIFERIDNDGVVSTGELTIGELMIETPNCFPILNTIREPNELTMIMAEKDRQPLGHIQGAVVRLQNVHKLIEPHTEQLNGNNSYKQLTLDSRINNKSLYENYYDTNLIICDPQMEKTYYKNSIMDKKFANSNFSTELTNYFSKINNATEKLDKHDPSIKNIRHKLYDDLWHNSRNDRNKMLTDLTKYQLQHFRMSVPASQLIFEPADVKISIEINEYCQGLSYQAKKDSASYFLFHKNAIKDEETMKTTFDYLRSNKQSKLNIIKFHDLDLHCPVDYKARRSFRNILADIIDIKESQPDRAFMLFDAGTQHYVATQAFDIVSTTLTGIDREITGGHRKKGVKYAPLWYDERKMWPRPTDDAPLPDPRHCDICSITPNFDFADDVIARRRRIHRLYDLDQNAKEICRAVTKKDVSRIMKKRCGFAEFSYGKDLIF